MPIPALNQDGFLPEGIHDCTLAEVRERFGQFQRTDQRCRRDRLEAFIQQCRATGFVEFVIVDGSFVMAADSPNDIDLLLVLADDHDFAADLRPFEYNVVSKRSVYRRFGFDVAAFESGNADLTKAIDFFSQIRDRIERKGMLRVRP